MQPCIVSQLWEIGIRVQAVGWLLLSGMWMQCFFTRSVFTRCSAGRHCWQACMLSPAPLCKQGARMDMGVGGRIANWQGSSCSRCL